MPDNDGTPAPQPPPASVPAPAATSVNALRQTLWDIAIKALFIIVPFLIGWGVKLEVNNARQELQIEQLQEQVATTKSNHEDIVEIKMSVNTLQNDVGNIEEKVDKIYDILLK